MPKSKRRSSYRGLKPGQSGRKKMIRGKNKGKTMLMKVGPSGKPYPVGK